jgi:SNF2 family DNA or RNA helicase
MDIEIKDHEILIWTNKAIAEKLGAKYMNGNKYKLPKTIEAVKDLSEFTGKPELKALYERMDRSRQAILLLKRMNHESLYGLRPYQVQDVNFLKHIPHAALFNEQRTGKTPTLLSLLRKREFKRNLIVVPAGLKLNWEKECAKWLPGIKTFVIRGPKSQRKRAYLKISELESFVMILSYDTLKAKDELQDLLAVVPQFDSMSVDEAHNLRNRKSKRTQAVQEMGKYATHRYALTGTPSVRDGHDVFPILQFLYPMKFTSYWAFVERYFEMKKDFFSGGYKPGKPIRYKELQNMLSMMGTNRKRAEVMQWLPDKTYTTIPIELTPRQRKAYDMVLETFEIESKSGELIVDAPSVLAQMTRLRQICLSPRMLGMDKVPSAKEQFLVEWLQDNKDEPVIIFSQFTSYLKLLAEVIKDTPIYEKVAMIHGEMSGAEKQQAVDDFQQGKVRILLGNIKAAGVGFTLDKATTTIFLDKEWNPVDNAQAEDRMVPVSKERIHKMDVISLVAANTYDERINELLENKINITSIVNNGGIQAIDRMLKEVKEHERT